MPDEYKQVVLDELVDQIYSYQPFGGGPHLNSGMIGLGPVTRALMDNGRQDVLWDLLQEDTQPSYGYFLQSTEKHPGGLTTIPEYWDLRQSQNHMILLQIDEWFTAGLAGIKQAKDSIGYRDLVIKPQVVGNLGEVSGEYMSPYGEVLSSWTRDGDDAPTLSVTVPSNSTAEVWAPTGGEEAKVTGGEAEFVKSEDGYAVYEVGPGSYTFAPADDTPPTTVPPTTVPPTTTPPTTVPTTTVPPTTVPPTTVPPVTPKVRVKDKVRAGATLRIRGRDFPVEKVSITVGGKKLGTAKVTDGKFEIRRRVPTSLSGKTVLRVLDRKGEVLVRTTVRVVRRNAA